MNSRFYSIFAVNPLPNSIIFSADKICNTSQNLPSEQNVSGMLAAYQQIRENNAASIASALNSKPAPTESTDVIQ